MEIDYSQLECYKACPRKYYNKYKQCLRKQVEDIRDVDTKFGKAIHSGLEEFYKTWTLEPMYAGFLKHFSVNFKGENVKTVEHGLKALELYYNQYVLQDKDFEILDTEVFDSVILDNGIKYLVKIDLVFKHMNNVYFMDHKTTGRLTPHWWDNFDLSSQLTGYTYYTKKKYGQCSGGWVNAINVGFRSRKYKDEPAGFYCKFERDIFNRNKEQIENWERELLIWTDRLTNDKDFPMTTSSCSNYRGCSFKQLCVSVYDESLMDSMYETYDPIAYLTD